MKMLHRFALATIGFALLCAAANAQIPLYGTGLAVPSTVEAGQPVLMTVVVVPAALPISTEITVVADLNAIGGAADQSFYDDGTNGDLLDGDNIFSFFTEVLAGTTPGGKVLPISIADAQLRTATTEISLTVPTPLSGTGLAVPST